MTNPYLLDGFIGQATKLTREAQNFTGVLEALLESKRAVARRAIPNV
jgi:hypothetical protein